MKYTALSLFVIGVASVNAGTVATFSSGSSSNNGQVGLVNGQGANTQVLPAGSAKAIAAQGGATASGASITGGWAVGAQANRNWEAQCDEENLEACHHDIHIGAAGQGASGDAVSNQYIVAAGEQVIPAQII